MNAYLYVQMSKMLIISPEFHCSQEILTVVAMLSGRCRFRVFLMGFIHFLSSQRLATTKH
jgi:HrpA-like RNA helicase